MHDYGGPLTEVEDSVGGPSETVRAKPSASELSQALKYECTYSSS